jgi:hypothetical protein
LASEGSSGAEVLPGTPLRMPSTPDYKSFKKMIGQVSLINVVCINCIIRFKKLPDTDAPYIFSLPDNIERSLQRFNSSQLIKQLRLLSSSGAEASKFDREKWRAQVIRFRFTFLKNNFFLL